jgi:Putative peptidoglycan binding domain
MKTQRHLTPGLAAIVLGIVAASPLRAADPALERFRAEIDAVVSGLAPGSSGILEWVGADPFEVRRDGDTLVAVITGARLTLHTDDVLHLVLDHLEVRETAARNGGDTRDLTVLLPKQVTFAEEDGTETKLTVTDGRVDAVIDARSGRTWDTGLAVAAMRFDHPKTGAGISAGPLAVTSKLVTEPDGRWQVPSEFELNNVEFSFPQGPNSGAIERIAFSGISAGPRVAEFERLRDTLGVPEKDRAASPDARLARLLAVLPTIPSVFGTVRGSAVLEGLSVRDGAGEPLALLTKAEFTTGASGFDGDTGALRFTIREDGLQLAAPLVDARLVPRSAILDFGVENLDTAALSTLLRAAALTRGGGEAEQQQQIFGALAMLNPVWRIYEIAIDTEDAGAELTAEAKGSPLSPAAYTADGDLVVRGWNVLPKLAVDTPLIEYLPFLEEFAEAAKAPDGSPRLKFHMASAPRKMAMINGNDVSLWFEEGEPSSGQPRLLKPAEPPLHGADVTEVQGALAAARLPVEQDGVYRLSTATAVARFQKQKGLNVSGVVDAATRLALGLREPAPRPAGRN